MDLETEHQNPADVPDLLRWHEDLTSLEGSDFPGISGIFILKMLN